MIEQIIWFGGGLAVLFSLGQLVRRFHVENALLFLVFASIGFWQIFWGLLLSNDINIHPLFNISALVFACVFGPSFYLYFRYIAGLPMLDLRTKLIYHYIPCLIVFTGMFTFAYTEGLFDETNLVGMQKVSLGYLLAGEAIYAGFYIVLFAKRIGLTPFRTKATEDQKKIRHIVMVCYCSLVAALIVIAFGLTLDPIVGKAAGLSITGIFVYVFLISQRYPELLLYLIENEQKKQYARSQLTNINVEHLQSELEALMTGDKLYQDDTLTLKTLAAQLRITSHQLSEFLNSHLNISFHHYVNNYRIQEAKDLLLKDLEMNVTTIAYQVGFNSISSFHNAFQRDTKLSPGKFRKKFAKKS